MTEIAEMLACLRRIEISLANIETLLGRADYKQVIRNAQARAGLSDEQMIEVLQRFLHRQTQ